MRQATAATPHIRFLAPLFALFACLATVWAPEAGAKRATCGGKKATIVSNAARIVGSKAHDVIVAGPGDNVIIGEGGNDTICGGGGNDRIHGGRGNDTIFGQGGNDTLHGERGSDRIDGGAGSDRVLGGTGNDKVDGGPGDGDHLDAGPGDDTASGGPGNFDMVHGGIGVDRIDGGPGSHDIASYKGVGGPIVVDLGAGRVGGAEQERLNGVEDVLGGSGNDTLIGNAVAPNRLDGGPGDDRLVAGGDGDEAFGGPGSDACSGRFVAETSCGPSGGANISTVELYESIAGDSSLIVTGSERRDEITVTAAMVAGADSILAALGGGDDYIAIAGDVPASIPATIDGGRGSDTLIGGPGSDTIYGGDDSEPDTLEGGGGDDALFGVNIFHPRRASGAARMIGGPGNDLMIGGQPCNGDLFDGGPGDNDSASFARVRNSGTYVSATIGGAVTDPDVGGCNAGRIESNVEKIEGSPGPDLLYGDGGANTLLGRGGDDVIDGGGGPDRCIGGGGSNRLLNCEMNSWRTPLRSRIR